MEKIKYKDLIILLFGLLFLARFFTINFIDKIPCMDYAYLIMGDQILSGVKNNINQATPALYGVIIKIINIFTGDLNITSKSIFIFSSLIISFSIYKICNLFFDKKVAIYSILISIVIPSLSVNSAGYSHTIYLGTAFMLLSIYFIEVYKRENKFYFFIIFIISTILAMSARNEYLFVIFAYSFVLFLLEFLENKNKSLFLKRALLVLTTIFLIIYLHKELIYFVSLEKEFSGIFSDKRYSYENWTHNLSFYFLNELNVVFSITKAQELYGLAENLNYSVVSAIISNPIIFIKILLSNLKDMMVHISYPSLFPFFNFIFLGLFLKNFKNKKKFIFLPFFISIICLVLVQLIFLSESRYLIPITAIFIIFMSKGVVDFDKKKFGIIIFLCLNLFISFSYVISYSKIQSLCF